VVEVRPWVTRLETRWIPVCRCAARRGPPGGVCGACGGAIPDATEEVRA
jgi:hypothetical protein